MEPRGWTAQGMESGDQPPGFERAVSGLRLWKPLPWLSLHREPLAQQPPGANGFLKGFLEQQFASAATWDLGLVDQRVN